MGEVASKYEKARRRADRGGERKERRRSGGEKRALEELRRLADEHDVELENDGEGGLPTELVLKVMKRDDFRCKRCGGKRKAPVTVHHKGGIVESEWLSKKGHKNDPNNIVTFCTKCHDDVHEEAREEGVDSSQKTPKGDRGDPKHDPDARRGKD